MAQEPEPHDMFVLGRYITEHQFVTDTQSAYGAIWTFANPIDGGDTVYKVIPYFAHYAAMGLLKCGTPAYTSAVKNWMNWYLSHLDSVGRMTNHYYSLGGASDSVVDPNDNDAQDADPAMFWVLAGQYYTATGDLKFFTKDVKAKLESQAKFIAENLLDADNLTFANVNYAMKYTMDNSEVYEGFMSLATIEKEAYHDIAGYNLFRAKAARTQAAIMLRLYDPVSGLYMNSTNTKTNVKNWYEAGVVATIWPQFCGVETYKAERSVHQREVLCQNFNDKNGKDWTSEGFVKDSVSVDTYPFAVTGYVFSMAGDNVRGNHQISYVVQMFKDTAMSSHLNIEEAGWGLMHLATIFKK
jgi:hypothetical protein